VTQLSHQRHPRSPCGKRRVGPPQQWDAGQVQSAHDLEALPEEHRARRERRRWYRGGQFHLHCHPLHQRISVELRRAVAGHDSRAHGGHEFLHDERGGHPRAVLRECRIHACPRRRGTGAHYELLNRERRGHDRGIGTGAAVHEGVQMLL